MLFMSPMEAIEWLTSTTQGFTCWPSHLHSSRAMVQNGAAEAMPSCYYDMQIRAKVKGGTLEPFSPLCAPRTWPWPIWLEIAVGASSPATATILPGAVLVRLTTRQHL